MIIKKHIFYCFIFIFNKTLWKQAASSKLYQKNWNILAYILRVSHIIQQPLQRVHI